MVTAVFLLAVDLELLGLELVLVLVLALSLVEFVSLCFLRFFAHPFEPEPQHFDLARVQKATLILPSMKI